MSLQGMNVTPLTMSVWSPEGPIVFEVLKKSQIWHYCISSGQEFDPWQLIQHQILKLAQNTKLKKHYCYKSVTSLFIIIAVFTNHDNLLHFNNGDLSLNIWQPNIEGTHAKLEREHNGER